MVTATYDPKKAEEFVGRILTDTSAMVTTVLASIGDRLGIWKDLAARGAATSGELAARSGLSERHLREWLGAMTAAGYLTHDGAGRFALPPEHAPALAEESGPMFFGGVHENIIGYTGPLERIVESFRTGGGVPQSAYPESTYDGMERFTGSWFENLLLPVWLPAAGVTGRLADGVAVADVGCGRGRALVKMAQAFPRSRFVGYDVYGPNIVRARANAQAAGVADRVRFVELDAAGGLPEKADLVTTFDVVHDAVDPGALLGAIRAALRPDGTYLCLEINCTPKLDEMKGPLGALLFGCSVLYCMSTSLAHDGAALGTCGLHAHKLDELARSAGFSRCEKLPIENPFNCLYRLDA